MKKGHENRFGKNILVTGPPRIGKSTLIERIVSRLQRPATGFFTREIRDRGKRVGFSIITLEGKRGVLAHQDIRGRFRVGKYGVNIEDIDRIAVPSMSPAGPDVIIVIDEIGKMECFSQLFQSSLITALDSENPVIGSIALKGDAFIAKIKRRKDISWIEVSEKNRDKLVETIQLEKPSGMSFRTK